MENLRNVSASPHIRGGMSTARIMQSVILALLPAAVFGVFNFGIRALLHILICVVTCVLTEFTIEAFTDLPITVGDFSSAVTGLLLALILPASAPLWIGVIGGIFGIGIVKICFGGLGQNIVNPALAARCFLLISFAGHMTSYACDAYSGATPLSAMKEGKIVDPYPMLLGTTGGCIGETSVIAILAGAVLLLALGIIRLRIPLTCLTVFSLMLVLFGGKGFDAVYLVSQVCGGGLLRATWFMATDYVTSPVTKGGQYVYGAMIGVLAALFRLSGSAVEGISYAILLANLMVPLIEKVTMPRAFGKKRR